MAAIFAALAPIFLVIGLGVAVRRWLGAEESFWRQVERMTYFVLFPALLVHRLATTPLPEDEILGANLALALPVLALTALAVLLQRLLAFGGADFATAAMASIRFNTYAGLAAALALYGGEGLAVFAVVLAVQIPLVNVISCLLLGRYAAPQAATVSYVLRSIASNPLVIACAMGIALNALGIVLPAFVERTLAILGSAALGLGLLSVGAALRIESLVADRTAIALAGAAKLLLLPALAAAGCLAFGVGGVARGVVVLFAALPASPAAYVLARQMGGNAGMMAGVITATTPAAMLTLPAALALFG